MKTKTPFLLLLALGCGISVWYFYPVFTFRGNYEGEFSDGSGKIKVSISDKFYALTFKGDDEDTFTKSYEYKVAAFQRKLLVDVGIKMPSGNEIEYYPVSLGYAEINYHEIKGETLWLQKVARREGKHSTNPDSSALWKLDTDDPDNPYNPPENLKNQLDN